MKTRFKIIIRDETEFWCDSIKQKAGKIFAAYLYDANRRVHCCELTPSYELYPLYSTPAQDDEEGSVNEEIKMAESDDVLYIHCRTVDRTPPSMVYNCGVETHDADTTWEEALNQAIDHYRGNVMIDVPRDFKLAA